MGRVLLVLFVLGAALVNAQAPAESAPSLGLVVGAGNFFSPIVSNLDRTVALYRDALGLRGTVGVHGDQRRRSPHCEWLDSGSRIDQPVELPRDEALRSGSQWCAVLTTSSSC